MPNQPKADRRKVSYYLPVDVAVRLRKYARARGVTVQHVVESLIFAEVKDVPLTSAEIEAIAKEVRENENKRRK